MLENPLDFVWVYLGEVPCMVQKFNKILAINQKIAII